MKVTPRRNVGILVIALATALGLLVPLIAMQFTEEVDWTAGDFVVAGALLFAAGLAFDRAIARTTAARSRVIACGAVLAVLLFIWAELAVGVFGD